MNYPKSLSITFSALSTKLKPYLTPKVKLFSLVSLCLILLSLYIFADNSIYTQNAPSNDKIITINTKNTTPKNSKLVYQIDTKTSTLKNPFNFEHETISEHQNSPINATSTDTTISHKNTASAPLVDDNLSKEPNKLSFDKHSNNLDNDSYTLKAVLSTNQHKLALLTINDKLYCVHVGDTLNNIQIINIDNQSLSLKKSNGTIINCPLIK